MTRILTTRGSGGSGDILQDIYYTYDAVGNITFVVDEADAQQTIYIANTIVKPEQTYTYDALYRLIEATGRENFNNTGFYEVTTPQGLGGNDVQNYERSFEYDLVGNITKMQHDASANSFTKHFHYDNDNNQLTRIFIGNSLSALESYTYDEHGNMLASNDRQFTYNLLDQLQVVDITGGSWKAFYMYNAEGQRDRKKVNNTAGTKDRFYFQNYERYREYDNADDLVLERYTHHIIDGEKKVVQWDTPTTLPSGSGEVETISYQYSNVLQSVGLELDQNADIISYEEYYPFGGTSYCAPENDIDVPKKRYKYCGKEQDEETGMYYYGARYYLPWLCRFSSVDPKALEYVHQSSYVFADNNPIVKYDVNGEGTGPDEDTANIPVKYENFENNAAAQMTAGMWNDAVDGLGNLIGTILEWSVTDDVEGGWVRTVLSKQGFEIPTSISDEQLGKAFSIRKESRNVVVQPDEGLVNDLLGMAIGALDVASVVSPSKGSSTSFLVKAFSGKKDVSSILKALKISARAEEMKNLKWIDPDHGGVFKLVERQGAAILEDSFGALRPATKYEGGDFFFTAGKYANKSVDLIGPSAEAVSKWGDDGMNKFLKSLSKHFSEFKSDLVGLDLRGFSPQQQKEVLGYISKNHSNSMKRLITINKL